MDREFYVYQLRIEGQELPFYIGKGKGYRANSHLYPSYIEADSNKYKANKIKKALKENKEIIVEILANNLEEREAFSFEESLILRYGRKNLGTGCLTNMTNGGEGTSGYRHNEETKSKIRSYRHPEHVKDKMKGRVVSEETRNRLSLAGVGHIVSKETRDKLSKSCSGYKHSQETKNKCALSVKGKKKYVSMLTNKIRFFGETDIIPEDFCSYHIWLAKKKEK